MAVLRALLILLSLGDRVSRPSANRDRRGYYGLAPISGARKFVASARDEMQGDRDDASARDRPGSCQANLEPTDGP